MGCFSSSSADQNEDRGGNKVEKHIDLENKGYQLNVTNLLGQGGSCKVYRSTYAQDTSKEFAVKVMDKPGPRKINTRLYKQEISILKKLDHPNIITLVESFENDRFYYVITVLEKGGELFERIANVSKYGAFTEKKAAAHVKTMLECLQYIHSLNIVHRDIKPENFVFSSTLENAKMILIDFGCALEVEDNKEVKDIVGTHYYLAPESAAKRATRDGKSLKKSDLWAVGVIAYIMLTGTPPFKGRRHNDILTEILTKPVTFPAKHNLSESFKRFVRKALKKPPGRRMSVDEALKHDWVLGKSAPDTSVHKEALKALRQFKYQTKLKKKVANLLSTNMGKEPEAKIRGHFEKLDTSNDGYLDLDELVQLLLELDGQISKDEARKQAANMMNQADRGKDNKIDFEEFATIWHRKLLSVNDKYIKAVFKVLDTDESGGITVDELMEVFESDDAAGMQNVLREVDTDGDGVINFAEFRSAMQEKIEKGDVGTGDAVLVGSVNAEDALDMDLQEVKDEFEEPDYRG